MTEDLTQYQQPFDPDWPHGHTYDGHLARMICRDLKGGPYVFAIDHGQIQEEIRVASSIGYIGVNQVRNAPAPKLTWWVNVFIDGNGKPFSHYHSSKEDADGWEGKYRIACIKVTEGEGLEDD